MISKHSSAVAAADKVRETVLERCLPEVRLQAKLRQYLKSREGIYIYKKNKVQKENHQEIRVKKKRTLKLTRTAE